MIDGRSSNDVIISCELTRRGVRRGEAEASGSGGVSACGRGNAVALTLILDRRQFFYSASIN